MFRYLQEISNGRLKFKYSCKFPQCWRGYYSKVESASTCTNVHFYKFPKDPTLRQQWEDICRTSDINWSSHRVCENHFLEKDFVNECRLRLNLNVIPKHLEIVPYNSNWCAGDNGVRSDTASVQETFPKNSDNNIDNDVDLGTNYVHGSIPSCSSVSLDEAGPSTSGNKGKGVLGTGVAKLNLSPRKSHMYKTHRNTMSRLIRLKNSLVNEKEKFHALKVLYEEKKFEFIEANLNRVTKSFINSQLRNSKRVPSARRWTTEDKVFALSLYKRSPRLYRYLAVQFSLPSIRVLKQLLSKIPFEPGLNSAVLKILQSEVGNMNELDRYCSLMLDEISLDKGLYYVSDKQIICGYQDLGHLGRCSRKANHALVYMLRGIHKSWKQAIAYYFTTNTISSMDLKVLISYTIREIQKIGLKIVCIVCDQGTTNQRAVRAQCRENINEPSDFYFFVNEEAIAVIYDVPHLLKNTRNALIDHKIQFESHKEAKFQYIQELFNLDQQKKFKTLPKLKKEYFNFKDSYVKMKVKVAAAQLSHTVAAAIETYVVTQVLPSEAIHTAEFVEKIDNLFDSLNSSERFPHDCKEFRCALSEDSPHITMWYTMLKEMENWKVIELTTGKDKTQMFSFINGWQTTIRSMMFIWNRVKKVGFKYLSTRAFNQDPLENLFCCIRQHGIGNTNPTCFQFKAALKTAILNNLALPFKSLGNCKDDGCRLLNSMFQFVSSEGVSSQNTEDNDGNNNDQSSVECSRETVASDCCIADIHLVSDKQALAYVAGYVLKRIGASANIECTECKNSLLSMDILESLLLLKSKTPRLHV